MAVRETDCIDCGMTVERDEAVPGPFRCDLCNWIENEVLGMAHAAEAALFDERMRVALGVERLARGAIEGIEGEGL